MNPPISVIVSTYTLDRWHVLREGISALHDQTHRPHQVLVVVDHQPAVLERAAGELHGTVALPSTEPPGLAGCRNTGARAATGSIVAFIDDDAVPAADWLERLAEPYGDDAVVAVGGDVIPNWAVSQPAWFPPEFNWVVGCSYRGLPETRAVVRNLIGANMSFRRQVFDQLEFYSGLGHANGRSLGGEETDFCIRLAEAFPGRRIVYEPQARVRHYVPPDRSRFGYFLRRCYNEGVSKGVLAGRVGSGAGLASERAYVRATLPAAALDSIADVARTRQPSGAFRVGAILTGVAAATSGYILSRLRRLSRVS
jgi:glycosyltransferase involved in cell wall biosynthesis